MRYTLEDGIARKAKHHWLLLPAIVLLGAGIYLTYDTLSPMLPAIGVDTQATAVKLKSIEPTIGENRLYLPQINVDVPIVEQKDGESQASALDRGALHRTPDNGNPKDGGNFVLAAHRFTLGFTPSETRAKSPFYHIDEMQVGDQVYVDYNGLRYAYKISEKKTVAPSDVGIEARTKDSRMTIYSCTLSGSNDGRVVLFADQIGIVKWNNGQPVVETSGS